MKISNELLLEDARKQYLWRCESYSDIFDRYMVKYDGDEELVRSLLFPMEYARNSAELNFYKTFFKIQKNKLALMRYLYDHLAEEYEVPCEAETDEQDVLPCCFADKPYLGYSY